MKEEKDRRKSKPSGAEYRIESRNVERDRGESRGDGQVVTDQQGADGSISERLRRVSWWTWN